ncbi:MAG: alkyl/aryl-sulfatase [Chloroflexota bacterium]
MTIPNATQLLTARSAEFKREIIQVAEGVYSSHGYAVSVVGIIVGTDGIVLVDTGMDPVSAEALLTDMRKISDLPIAAVLFTHSHPDHIGGLPTFLKEGVGQIWGRDNFGAEMRDFVSVGLTVQGPRGVRQGGFKLPPEKRINNGIAQAYYPQRKNPFAAPDGKPAAVGSPRPPATKVELTHRVSQPRQTLEIAGIKIELVATVGETHDHLYVWLPETGVLFCGDNYYKSWPNLYPIRGSVYRDIQGWINSLGMMIDQKANVLVAGHTRPLIGADVVEANLTLYRDGIQYIFEETIAGMNRGLTPDQLVATIELPERFQGKDSLRPYYGHPDWAIRAIFAHYMGWFDGNPVNLFDLTPVEEAQEMAEMAGGAAQLLIKAQQAHADGRHVWAAKLCDHLLALDSTAAPPKRLKADALDAIGETVLSGIGRNYYFTVAQELRTSAQ